MVSINRIIDVLERARHEHYDGGYEGLAACDAGRTPPIPDAICDCGADEINLEIDKLINELRATKMYMTKRVVEAICLIGEQTPLRQLDR